MLEQTLHRHQVFAGLEWVLGLSNGTRLHLKISTDQVKRGLPDRECTSHEQWSTDKGLSDPTSDHESRVGSSYDSGIA